ncbi:MAG TPA: hypothetical protein VGE74_13295 [Gemmata sp.]
MEHIPAIHAAKVGMRYPARVRARHGSGLLLELDLTLLAPGRAPRLLAELGFHCTVGDVRARALPLGDRIDVVATRVPVGETRVEVSLPAEPDWLVWNGGTVRHLAQRCRATGDMSLLPVLADALEDAGCAELELLARCRAPDAPERDALEWLVELLAAQE